LEKKFRFEKKVKHLKGINQSSKGKGNDGKRFFFKMESFEKKLRKMEKKNSMEHQSSSLQGVAKRRHKVENKFWRKIFEFKLYIICFRHINIYYFTYIHEINNMVTYITFSNFFNI